MWWGIVREGGCEGGISNVWSHLGQVPSITFHSVNILRALDHSISAWSAGNANAGPCANIRRAQWRMDTYVCECALCCGSVLYAVSMLYLIHTCTCKLGISFQHLLWRLLWGQNRGSTRD